MILILFSWRPLRNAIFSYSLTLREEQRLSVFENEMYRKIFGAKRDVITGKWINLHNAELEELYSSPDINRNLKYMRSNQTKTEHPLQVTMKFVIFKSNCQKCSYIYPAGRRDEMINSSLV